jgi:hypothetical protein
MPVVAPVDALDAGRPVRHPIILAARGSDRLTE